MKWRKISKIFEPKDLYPWMKSHAANAFAVNIGGDLFRVYFSTRDANNRSSISFVELNINKPEEILKIASEPVLSPGEIGTFDDSGVSLASIIDINGRRHMYYLGWNLGVTVPWTNTIGLAIENPQSGKFERYSKAPIVNRSDVDPYSLSYPFLLADSKGGYHVYYGSNLTWGKEQESMAHVLKYASTTDGINWQRDGHIAINFKDSSEYAISRGTAIKDSDCYKIWYSYRGLSYRIGYAESTDGKNWIRKDEQVGISVSDSGWDSETVEYPHVFDHKGSRFMIYNGNGYGLTGFGLAVLE